MSRFALITKYNGKVQFHTIGTFKTRAAALRYAQSWLDHWATQKEQPTMEVKVARLLVDKRYTKLTGRPRRRLAASFKKHTQHPVVPQ